MVRRYQRSWRQGDAPLRKLFHAHGRRDLVSIANQRLRRKQARRVAIRPQPQEDKVENEVSLLNGYRLLSAYRTKMGERLWVLTEADRSLTTILLPEEY